MTKRTTVLLLLAGLTLPGSVVLAETADQLKHQALFPDHTTMSTVSPKGVPPSASTFALGGADINAFNFNFVVQFSEPGLSRPVSGGLTLEMPRWYNSAAYTLKQTSRLGILAVGGDYGDLPARPWYGFVPQFYVSVPRQNPLGLGWDLHFGRIYAAQREFEIEEVPDDYDEMPTWRWQRERYIYVAPDGSEHEVFDEDDGRMTVDGTRIGSIAIKSPGGRVIGWDLYLPDGRVVEMRHKVGGETPLIFDEAPENMSVGAEIPLFTAMPPGTYERNKVGFYATRIRTRDLQDNQPTSYIDIIYHDAPFDYIPKTITDSHGRGAIEIIIEKDDPSLPSHGHITKIRYPLSVEQSPDGELASTIYGETSFEYERRVVPIQDTALVTEVLTRVTQPGKYGFIYGYRAVDEGTRIAGNGVDLGLQLNRIDYPSGKVVHLEYGRYMHAVRDLLNGGLHQCLQSMDPIHIGFMGLKAKREYASAADLEAGRLLREWTFGSDRYQVGETTTMKDKLCSRVGAFFPQCPALPIPDGVLYEARHNLFNIRSWMIDPGGNRTEIVYDTSSPNGPVHNLPQSAPTQNPRFGTPIQETRFKGAASTDPIVRRTTREWDVHYPTGRDNFGCYVSWREKWVTVRKETVEILDDPYPSNVTRESSDWGGVGYLMTKTSGTAVDVPIIERVRYAQNHPTTNLQRSRFLPPVVVKKSLASIGADGEEVFLSMTQYAFDHLTGRTVGVVERLNPAAVPSDTYEDLCDPDYELPPPIPPKPCQPLPLPGGELDITCAEEDPPPPPEICTYARAYDGTMAELAPTDGDRVTEFTFDARGDMVREVKRLVGTVGEYKTEYGYDFGVQAWARSGDRSYFDVIREVHPETRAVVRERANAASIDDSSAVQRTYFYDDIGRLTTEEVGSLKPWTYSYEDVDLDGTRKRLKSITSAHGDAGSDGRTESVDHFNTLGQVETKSVLRPDGTWARQHMRYTNTGRVAFASEWTKLDRTADGLVGTTTDYSVSGTGVEDPLGRLTKVTGPLRESGVQGEEPREITTFEYQGLKKRVSVHNVATGTEVEVPRTAITEYFTDGLDRLRVVDAPAGGVDAIYAYDAAGRLIRAALCELATGWYAGVGSYAAAEQKCTTPAQVRTFAFDALGRQVSAKLPEGGETKTLAFNALGQATKVQDALGMERGHLHETTYDDYGRPTQISRNLAPGQASFSRTDNPGATGWTTGSWSTSNAVTCAGKTAWYVGNGACTYAATARLDTTMTSPAISASGKGTALSFDYYRKVRYTGPSAGGKDRLDVSVCQSGTTTCYPLWSIDSRQQSWAKWVTSPSLPVPPELAGKMIVLKFRFDSGAPNTEGFKGGIAIGQVRVTRPSSVLLAKMNYDEGANVDARYRSKLTTIRSFDDATGAASHVRSLRFDQAEGLLSGERIWVDVDRDGSLEDWNSDHAADAFAIDYAYDALGQLTGRTLPHVSDTGRAVVSGFAHGGLTGVSVGGVAITQSGAPGFVYNEAGGIRSVHYANGVDIEITPNEAYLPTQIVATRSGSVLFDSGTYKYDGARNIKQIGPDLYRYDLNLRLDWSRVGSPTYGTLDLDNVYDIYGNMTAQNRTLPGGGATTVGPPGLAFGGLTFERNRIRGYVYDANGNLLQEPVHDGVGGFVYQFSPENRLSAVQMMGSGVMGAGFVQESRYDAQGNRWLRSTVEDGGKVLLSIRDMSNQVAADFEVVPGPASAPVVEREYVYGNGKVLAMLANGSNSPEFVIWDHLGSTRAIVGADGAVLSQSKFYPFGLAAWQSGTTENRKEFTGHERDKSVGLDYMLARYHSPALGRFLSVDPLGKSARPRIPQSWNRYTYVLNGPVVAVDLTGEIEARLYGESKTRDVNPGDVVVLVDRHGQAAHVAVISGFVKGKDGRLEAMVFENVPVTNAGKGTLGVDSTSHKPKPVNSNSREAGGGIWNGQGGYKVGIVQSNSDSDGSYFTAEEVAAAVTTVVGEGITYNINNSGDLSSETDCAGFVNQVVDTLGGVLSGTTFSTGFWGLLGYGKAVNQWLYK